MGEPVTVIEKSTSRQGYVRFETNRWLTGMGHERFVAGQAIYGDRPAARVARLLFGTDQVDEVHVYGQAVTVHLRAGSTSAGLSEVLADLYTYYLPGVEVPSPESFGASAG